MKKSKFSESAMVRAVQHLESGVTADIICREMGISRHTLYTWRSKYSGMEISQVKMQYYRYLNRYIYIHS